MLALIALLCTVLPAFAGAVLVGTAPLPADGTTASDVQVYIEKCPSNLRARVKAESGKVATVTSGADCVVSFSYTPPAVSAAKSLPVVVSVQSEDYTVQVPVVPPFSGSIDLAFDPPVVQPGGSATVKVKPQGTSPVSPERRRFVLTANVGTIDSPVPLGDGTYSARYVAPKTLTGPVMVAITAADAASPAIQGWATLPITLKKPVAFDAPSGSSNMLTVGGKPFGPLKADSKNKVTFEVELDPRYPTGRLQTVNVDTSRTEREVPMPSVPQVGQLVFLPLPASVVADPANPLPVRVVALSPSGEALSASDMVITTSGGTLTAPGPDGKVMASRLTVPATAGEITLGANWNGLIASRKLKVLAPLPQMTLATEPAEIPKGGGTVKVVARLKDSGGTALAGRNPSLTLEGASLSGSVKDNKDGTYGGSLSGSSKVDRVRIFGAPQVDVSSLAPARILAWPASATVSGNGLDSTIVTIVAVDAYDLPLANVDFALSVPVGDGVIAPTVKSDARGIARIAYKAGTRAGLATLRIEGGGLVTELPIFQVGKGVLAAPAAGGSAAHKAALDRWQRAAPSLTLVREGVVPPSGPPAAVQITATPGFTTPGAAILVQVRVSDDAGAGVAKQTLQVSASPATVGAITDNRDGSYTFPVQLPAGKDGPISITVAAQTAVSSLQLLTLDQAGSAAKSSGSASSGGGASSGVGGGGSTTVNRPAPSGGGDVAAGRFGGLLMNTRGPFTANVEGGGLAKASLEAPGAGFWGLGVQAHYGLPVGPGRLIFGANGRLTANVYSVNEEAFLVLIRDVTLGGRYLHPVAEGITVGGGLDLHSLSSPYFTYTDEARTAATLGVGDWLGVRLAGQLDVDLSSGLHMSVDLAETFAWAPAVTHAGVLVDIPAGDTVAVRLNASWDWHYLPVTDLGGTGTLDEHVIAFGAGAVYVLR